MKKQDVLVVVCLFALMLAWPMVYGWLFPPAHPPAGPRAALTNVAALTVQPAPTNGLPTALSLQEAEPRQPALTAPAPVSTATPATPATPPAGPALPERRATLSNAMVVVTVSSHGGGVVAAEFERFRRTVEPASGPLILDFSNQPALTYAALAGLSTRDDFALTPLSDTHVRAGAVGPDGLRFTRDLALGDHYLLTVTDTFANVGAQTVTLPAHGLQLGPMHRGEGESGAMGLDVLGVDALLSTGGEGVKYWAGDLPKLFKTDMKEQGLDAPPLTVTRKQHTPVDWVAAKNKFFVQIFRPDQSAEAYRVGAERTRMPGEETDPSRRPKSATVESVSAAALFPAVTLAPGESLTRVGAYYVGPKQYAVLKQLGRHQDDVMDFGWWKSVCKVLLYILNAMHDWLPSYGLAIILLTLLIRVVFWPLTHKSTESMKKLQALQPLMLELRAKYKDNPKKMQEETLGLYRKHKVNPMGGCLPMLVQIPVLFALFVVLRSAIELRFAEFLWIRDLSEPERLFADVLGFPLNILPLYMAATMAWQQQLMPTADPMQQKMMLYFMPVMMLFMFYSMPSALVLYWSANQTSVIIQQLIQKKRAALKAARAPAAA